MTDTLSGSLKSSIRLRLSARGITQKQMANDLGLSEKHVSHVLSGRTDGSLDTIDRMIHYVGMELVMTEHDMDTFLSDMDTSVHIMQMGADTTVLTKLTREGLIEYLERLTTELKARQDSDDTTDLIAARVAELPTGDRVQAFMLRVNVF